MVRIADLESGPYWKLVNMTTETAPDGEILAVLKVTDELLQVYGNVHGGVIAALMDSCIAIALNQQLGPSKGATTVEMKLNYLRPVNKGILKGQGRVIQAGRRILVGQGEIRDEEDNLVAIGTATFVIIDKPFNLRTS